MAPVKARYFELRAFNCTAKKKNLLPPIKHLCFAPGNDFDGCFDHFDS